MSSSIVISDDSSNGAQAVAPTADVAPVHDDVTQRIASNRAAALAKLAKKKELAGAAVRKPERSTEDYSILMAKPGDASSSKRKRVAPPKTNWVTDTHAGPSWSKLFNESKWRKIWIRDVFCSKHLRCFGGGKTRLESSTKKFNPHVIPR